MVNPEIINERLREIEENITLLKEIDSVSLSKFCMDPKILKLAERCLQVSMQCILDICHHIIVENNWRRPRDNKEAIIILSQKDIIPSTFAKHIVPMAGLRNLLVHEYIKIDPKLIYKHLQDIKDFRKFQRYILKYIKQ